MNRPRRSQPPDFRFYVPRNPSDRLIYFIAMFLIFAEFAAHFLVTMPKLCGSSLLCNILRFAIWLFLLLNVLWNMHMFCVSDSSTVGLILPVTLKPGWRYCSFCEANSPPRSTHCPHCNRCVLRQDHHCVFTGCCIGYKNARYFIALLFYLSVSAIYFLVTGLLDTLGGVADELQHGSSESGPMLYVKVAFSLIMPLFSLVLGYVSLGTAIQCTLMSINILCTLICSFMCLFQLLLATRNQTTNEWAAGKKEYTLGMSDNLVQLLGHRWQLTLLLSFFNSPLPLDGLEFPNSNDGVRYRAKHT